MNALDRLIGWVAPAAGLRRAQARAAMNVVRHYEAADTGRRMSGRTRSYGDANTVMQGKAALSAEAARDLVRNNAWANKALATIVGNTVGSGITSEPRLRNKARGKLLGDAWLTWAMSRKAHAAQQLNWYGIQALALRAVAEAGAAFVVRVVRNDRTHPLTLKVLEREYLDTSKGVNGIEYDDLGAPVRYWLYDTHPGDSGISMTMSSTSTGYSAADVVHLYRIDRPGQRNGMTWFAPVVLEMHDLDGYEDATLLKQKVAACYTGFITREGSDPFGADDTPITSALEPGGLEILPKGSSITFGNPPTATEYTPFVKQRLRRLAAGLGISYEALSGDLSEVNYSSGRMGWAEFSRNIDMWQHQMLIPGLIARVADWFTSLALVTGIVNQADVDRMWWAHNPPRRTVVDPAKEFPAIRDGIRAGLMTLPEALRDLGKSFDSQMEEQAAANAELDRLGLTVESDARVSMAGGAKTATEEQPTPTPPAPEVPA